jgi:uncharacterized membrane protein
MTETPGKARRHGRPLHPPFTHFPIAAYVMAAAFDVISVVGGRRHAWSGQLWHAGTFVVIAGLVLCLATMLTGFADLVRFGERTHAAMRIIAVHVCVMASVFMLGVGDLAIRLSEYNQDSTPPPVLILTIAAAVGVSIGGFLGGTLVYKHGAGVAVAVGPARGIGSAADAVLADPFVPEPAFRPGSARHNGARPDGARPNGARRDGTARHRGHHW